MRKSLLVALSSLLVLAGCSEGMELERSTGLTPRGGEFNAVLYEHYLELSKQEYQEGHYAASDIFAVKGHRAADGETVLPFALEGVTLPPDERAEIADARAALMSVLDKTARTKAPQAAGKAQTMFDCWVEEQSYPGDINESDQPEDAAYCRDNFRVALGIAEEAVKPPETAKPEPAPRTESVAPATSVTYFDFDRATLRTDARQIVEQTAQDVKSKGAKLISITGHADRAGPTEYNRDLSLQRAESVREALVARGVATDIITVAARGESQPAVPTADGVAEQRNRRVEILIEF